MSLKILHIWNIGGTSLIARTMNRLFPESYSTVVMRKVWDIWNLTTYGELWDVGPKMFVAKALLYSRKFDIIHVHALDKIVPWIKLIYPRKPVVLQYHGLDIRGEWNDPNKVKLWSKADVLLVWTSDLLEGAPANVKCLTNPVDTELFFPNIKPASKGKAFHFSYYADEEAKALANKMKLYLDIHDRLNNPIPNNNMPNVYSQYEYYIDVKRKSPETPVIRHISRSALEALACGLKVITAEGKVIEAFPEEHNPENVARELWKVYSGLHERSL
ncbi:MAG TPA: hypothetical protein VGQ13_03895 [Nitrososphaera sp.]|jgi:hypothetical protein|nr:hypothetical protein [Nitrososphaera sp.]